MDGNETRTLIHERVESARVGANPTVIAQMPSGWAVIGDTQFLAGYCLLLPDPVVSSINDLVDEARARFLADMVAIGDALLEVTDAYRINYEILGNTEQALHAHIFARYRSEPPDLIGGQAWSYSAEVRERAAFDPERDRALMARLVESLTARGLVRRKGPLLG